MRSQVVNKVNSAVNSQPLNYKAVKGEMPTGGVLTKHRCHTEKVTFITTPEIQ